MEYCLVSVKCDQASQWFVRAGAEICILNDTRIDKSLKNKVSVQLLMNSVSYRLGTDKKN